MKTLAKVTSPDGTSIGWEQSGTGPPLVLIHGTAADHTRWAPVLPALEEQFTVVGVDRRGRGLSGDGADYAVEREYEDIAAVADSFKEPVHLLGHSFGAMVALNTAPLSSNVRSVTLYEGGGPGGGTVNEDLLARIDALVAAGDRDGALSAFMKEMVGLSDEALEQFKAKPAWQGRVAAAHTLTREIRVFGHYKLDPGRYAEWSTPALILSGGASSEAAKKGMQALHEALPGSRLEVMEGQQHIAMDTGTQIFLDAVIGFLKAN